MSGQRTLWLDEVTDADGPRVGRKAANLALLNQLARVPRAFCVLSNLFDDHLRRSGAEEVIERRLFPAPPDSDTELFDLAERIRQRIVQTEFRERDCREIRDKHEQLGAAFVAVRSSGVAEDLPGSSFAGQYRSHLGVRNATEVLAALRDCLASLYSPLAINYRRRRGIREGPMAFGAIVQEMVDACVAGVVSTVHPVSGASTEVVVESAWGLGSVVVSGEVTPDHFVVLKTDLSIATRAINPKRVARYLGAEKEHESLSEPRRLQSSLTESQVIELARIGIALERRFGEPQDFEWAIDRSGVCWLLQTRPVTGLAP